MKKVHREPSPGQQSADYVVGQVSGSLFLQNSAATGSLSALFSTAAPAASVLFQPPPKPIQKSLKTEAQKKETPEVQGEAQQQKRKKKANVDKSVADQQLENRESSLQKADDDEQGQEGSVKKKRKVSESGRENDAEHWVLKRQKMKAIKNEEALRGKRTVFVGNLPVSCTRKMLQSLFRDKGSIESIRFRSMVREDPSMSRKVAAIKRKAHPQKQSLNAYVVFKDEDGVNKALERNGVEIEKDFFIRVDRVTDNSSHDHKRSVFVGNLSFEMNELAFRKHFEECGRVEAVRLIRDQKSGLGKGFGYVLFESADSVLLALKLDGSKLEGRSIRVKRSVKKEKQNKTSSKGTTMKPNKSPVQGSGRETRPGRGGFKPPKTSTSFKGVMVDPNKKIKKKGLKKRKVKPKKNVHI